MEEYFRSHCVGGATAKACYIRHHTHIFSKTEVSDLRHFVFGNQNILKFKIAMDDVLAEERIHSLHDLL